MKNQCQKNKGMWLVFIIFLICPLAARGWFERSYVLKKNNTIVINSNGGSFLKRKLSPNEIDILKPSSYINGDYYKKEEGNDKSLKLFFAHWDKNDLNIEALTHNPDVCWIGVGWKAVDLKQPSQVIIPFTLKQSDESVLPLRFECRIMENPVGQRELVIWTALMGGECLIEEDVRNKNQNSTVGLDKSMSASRELRLKYFLNVATGGLPADRGIQYLRVSVAMTHDWEKALLDIKTLFDESVSIRN